MKGNIFIKRPVMAFSISILILIIGFISLVTLPVEQYPDIAPPTVRVSTSYTGADAEAIDYLLNAKYYVSASGPVNNSKSTTQGTAGRCVRDAYVK